MDQMIPYPDLVQEPGVIVRADVFQVLVPQVAIGKVRFRDEAFALLAEV